VPKHVAAASQNKKYLRLHLELFGLNSAYRIFFGLSEEKLEYIEIRKDRTDGFGFQIGDCVLINKD